VESPSLGYLKTAQTLCLATWLSGGLGSVKFMVGLNDLKGLFQPKRSYDSVLLDSVMILCCFLRELAKATLPIHLGRRKLKFYDSVLLAKYWRIQSCNTVLVISPLNAL